MCIYLYACVSLGARRQYEKPGSPASANSVAAMKCSGMDIADHRSTLLTRYVALCVAVCCSVLQRVAACCSVLQRVAACCSEM